MPADIIENRDEIDKEIEEEIERLRSIQKLRKDPKACAMLQRFFGHNGNGAVRGKGSKATSGAASSESVTVPPHNFQLKNEAPRKYGEMRKIARQVLCSTPQTTQQIVDSMVANGWQPSATDPRASVAEVLRNMVKRGEAKKAPEKGDYGQFQWTN